ncbi:MAG: Cytochrome c protein [Chloroflexi bacterium]|nr:Cytochrome c protein [Chloroflexota bacterium]
MSDQPGREPEQRLPALRSPTEAAPAGRFSAPESAHPEGLSPQRSAQIVRQSASARWVGFLVTCVVVLFVMVYYFYEVGAPLGLTKPRLEAQDEAQQVTSIERGYNLYVANCARCHGPNGKGSNEGWPAPPLNDQAKLFDHLKASYLKNVLTVGGRYVCGDPKSGMPTWSNVNGGPLNYKQVEDLIAFIRAPSTQEYIKRHPELNEPIIGADGKVETFKGWRDPAFKPDPAATPVPDCWSGSAGGTEAPTATLPPDAQVVTVTAETLAFDPKELTIDAGKAWGIDFFQKDSGVGGHDVDIRAHDGTVLIDNAKLNDPGETTYVMPPLEPGTYVFICSVHPIEAMTGTLTVK